MFESLSARELVDVIGARARASATAEAQKFAAIAELQSRRLQGLADFEDDAADGTDGTAAEISAVLNIGHGRALGEIDTAMMLARKYPLLNALFLLGLLTARRVWILAKHTDLVIDPAAIAKLDAALADRVVSWGPLSEWKFEQLVDAEIAAIDPAAVRRVKQRVRDRDFEVGRRDGSGTVAYWGRMSDPDAAVSVAQIRRMTRMVCPDDPRTLAQRRGDAHAALMAGSTVLRCMCGNPDCAAAQVDDAAAGAVNITVITDQASLDAALATLNGATPADAAGNDADAGGSGGDDGGKDGVVNGWHGPRTVEGELDEIVDELDEDAQHDVDVRIEDHVEPPVPDPADDGATESVGLDDGDGVDVEADWSGSDRTAPEEPDPAEPPVPDPDTSPAARPARPPRVRARAVIPGYGVMPPVLLADLIARGAPVRPIRPPGPDADPGYRPSTLTDRFVRERDLTCRAPGCDVRAAFSDIDHTIPYPAGVTHAGAVKCYCRKFHLIKTFHPGWSDRQLPDGSIEITTPTGHVYTTKPGITLLFPEFDVTTPAPPPTGVPTQSPNRLMKMPKRTRTRAQARTDRINAERARNTIEEQPPPF